MFGAITNAIRDLHAEAQLRPWPRCNAHAAITEDATRGEEHNGDHCCSSLCSLVFHLNCYSRGRFLRPSALHPLYACVRVCNEAMDVAGSGVQNRGSHSVIAPNMQDHLECEECGMCIDICPVGALTSGAYRYRRVPGR